MSMAGDKDFAGLLKLDTNNDWMGFEEVAHDGKVFVQEEHYLFEMVEWVEKVGN